ncbi:MAG: DEAD/DEAH box helicase, partial [Halieaceae bacterium]|nr:DEAD/DEAH box helicase [Halieaceae bacterium]
MLPSLVVEEVRRGVAETLRAQFEPSTELFKDAIRRLIETPPWVQGPYVQLGLPFVAGSSGKDFFTGFETEFPAHHHQELAWELCGRQGRSMLVATGTGSGKTECFLYPVLEHVAQARQAGARGIKAIIVYPMNALADDQAGRIAKLVHKTPAFAGIRAGLFVGSGKARWKPGKQGQLSEQDYEVMGTDHVITDKEVQRNDPPDILLTNYKMLDFLMIRPRDQGLWQHNDPDTLRYLVVDELHTFDGAQGTDLAMLIRRLRHRLGCEDERLVCVGTSATLGDASDTQPLREYAGQVFATTFDPDAVVAESRQGFDEFIGNNNVIEHLLADDRVVLEAVAHHNFATPQEVVTAYLPAFFVHSKILGELMDSADTVSGRVHLGSELKKHLLFQTLLRTAAHSSVTVETITDRMRRTLSASLQSHAPAILAALLALVAWARAPHAGQKLDPLPPLKDLNSLVTLRLQVWLQELRRVVATVSADEADIELASEATVLSRQERLRLPVVQCRQCRTTGWLTVKPPQEGRVQASLERIYSSFFARNQDTFLARLYPRFDESHRLMAKVQKRQLCGQCGNLENQPVEQCSHCQSANLAPVHLLNRTRSKNLRQRGDTQDGTAQVAVHDDICPVCGARGEQLIIGAQTTSIAAHAVERLWSAPLNPHKKLILFSDSVQDAAHRAGFI